MKFEGPWKSLKSSWILISKDSGNPVRDSATLIFTLIIIIPFLIVGLCIFVQDISHCFHVQCIVRSGQHWSLLSCVYVYSLDLDKWINAPPSDSSDEDVSSSSIFAPSSDRSAAWVFCCYLSHPLSFVFVDTVHWLVNYTRQWVSQRIQVEVASLALNFLQIYCVSQGICHYYLAAMQQ